MDYAKWENGEYRHGRVDIVVSELIPSLGAEEVEMRFGVDALEMTRQEARDLGNRLLAAAGMAK